MTQKLGQLSSAVLFFLSPNSSRTPRNPPGPSRAPRSSQGAPDSLSRLPYIPHPPEVLLKSYCYSRDNRQPACGLPRLCGDSVTNTPTWIQICPTSNPPTLGRSVRCSLGERFTSLLPLSAWGSDPAGRQIHEKTRLKCQNPRFIRTQRGCP